MISLHRRKARAICAFPQGMRFQCLMTSSSFGRVFSLHRHRARAMFAFQGGMRCDDQTPNPEPLAPRLTQVPPYLPKWPQDGPDNAQDGSRVQPNRAKVPPREPRDGLNSAQDAHLTACNIQIASHIASPAECAVAIKSRRGPASHAM